jgi:hypothetical protein
MSRSTIQYALLGLILLIALGAAFGIQHYQSARAAEAEQQASALAASTPGTQGSYIYLVDTEGWYNISPRERAAVSRFNLKLGPDIVNAIPQQLGSWLGKNDPVDPAVYTFIDPLYVTNRRYISGTNDMVYFTLLASSGQRSFKLFEHTASICYPTNDWKVLDTGIEEIPVGRGTMYVQKVVAQKAQTTYVTYYWFQWDNVQRNQESGTMAIKVSAYVDKSIPEAAQNARNFISQLYTDVVQWRRF